MLRFLPISTAEVQTLRNGYDANQQPPEFSISGGGGVPCRHCLDEVTEGQPLLTLAYRPFKHIQPYAELGPIYRNTTVTRCTGIGEWLAHPEFSASTLLVL